MAAAVVAVAGIASGTKTEAKTTETATTATTETTETATETATEEMATFADTDVTVSYDYTEETETSDDGTLISDVNYYAPKINVNSDMDISGKMADAMEKLRIGFKAESRMIRHKALEDYQDSLKTGAGKKKTSDTFSAYTLSQDYTKGRMDNGVISVCACRTEYTGDEHGDYIYTGYNYDAYDGHELSLSDISDNSGQLRRSCMNEIKRQCAQMLEKAADQDTSGKDKVLTDDYQDVVGEVVADGSWYFTRAGICFVANTYMIAPYSQGAVRFTVPYDKLQCLKKRYRYNGNMYQAVRTGESTEADLDGDRKNDTIVFSMEPDSKDGTYKPHLLINGKDFGNILQKDDVSISSMYENIYYIVDLDMNDKYKDIAILDNGYSDVKSTYFFRYNGKSVTYLGKVNDELLGNTCDAPGNGTITASERISVLETANAGFTYRLTGVKLKQEAQEWYHIDHGTMPEEYRSHEILGDVTVYKKKSRKSAKKVLKPADGPVMFTDTDNEHWVKVVTRSGDEYCMYMEDQTTVYSDGKKIGTADIFDNLYLAD